MLNTKDLRIENLVQDSNDRLAIVNTISSNTARLTALNGSYIFETFRDDAIKGVKLTDELLINKAKFLMVGNHYVFHSEDLITSLLLIPSEDGYFYPQIFQEPEMSNEREQAVCLHRIEFFHELQNLLYTHFKTEI